MITWTNLPPAPDCPCRGCKERTPTCHDTCERYLSWKADCDEKREARRKAELIERRIRSITRRS